MIRTMFSVNLPIMNSQGCSESSTLSCSNEIFAAGYKFKNIGRVRVDDFLEE